MLFLFNMIFSKFRYLLLFVLLLFCCFSISLFASIPNSVNSRIILTDSNFPLLDPQTSTRVVRAGDALSLQVDLRNSNDGNTGFDISDYEITLRSVPVGITFQTNGTNATDTTQDFIVTANISLNYRYSPEYDVVSDSDYKIIAEYSLKNTGLNGGFSQPLEFDSFFLRVKNSMDLAEDFSYTIAPTSLSNIFVISFEFRDVHGNIVDTVESGFNYDIDYMNVSVSTKDISTNSSELEFHSSFGPFTSNISAGYTSNGSKVLGVTAHSYSPDAVPIAPTIDTFDPSENSVSITWLDNSNLEEGFRVVLMDEEGNVSKSDTIAHLNNDSNPSTTVFILSESNSRFTLYVEAYNDIGFVPSEVILFHTIPNKVEDNSSINVELYPDKISTVRLDWETEDVNHANTLYRIEAKDVHDNKVFSTIATATSESDTKLFFLVTSSGFVKGANYKFSVIVLYDDNNQNSWDSSVATLDTLAGDVPVYVMDSFSFFEVSYRQNPVFGYEGAEFDFYGNTQDVLLHGISTADYSLNDGIFQGIQDGEFRIYDGIDYSSGTASNYVDGIPEVGLFTSVRVSSDANVDSFSSGENEFNINFSTGVVDFNIPSSYNKSISVTFSSTSLSTEELVLYVPDGAFEDDVVNWKIIPSTTGISQQISTATISLLYSSAAETSLSFEIQYTDASKIKISKSPQLRVSTGLYSKIYNDNAVSMDDYSLVLLRYSDDSKRWLPYKSSKLNNDNYYTYDLDTLNGVYKLYLVQGNFAANNNVVLEERIKVYPNPLNFNSYGVAQNMRFIEVPEDAKLFIYTHLGELVRMFNTVASDGVFEWDGRNQNGSYVGSGVYIAVIRSGYSNSTNSNDEQSASFVYRVKVAIQR